MSKIYYKSAEEIELIRESGVILTGALAEIASIIAPGITTLTLNKIGEAYIRDNGGVPAFLNYSGFPFALCVSPNEQVVHGMPSEYVIQEGDLISVDCGVIKNNFYSDSAYTFAIGEVDAEKRKLLDVTKQCLMVGIEKAVAGARVGDVGYAIQKLAEDNGFSVVKELVGHGIGLDLHEQPDVPNHGKRGGGIKLQEGMVICIEPMINAGVDGVTFWSDGWTVTTNDKRPSAHYEHMVAIKKGKADVLSSFLLIEEVLKKKSE